MKINLIFTFLFFFDNHFCRMLSYSFFFIVSFTNKVYNFHNIPQKSIFFSYYFCFLNIQNLSRPLLSSRANGEGVSNVVYELWLQMSLAGKKLRESSVTTLSCKKFQLAFTISFACWFIYTVKSRHPFCLLKNWEN